MPGQCKITFFFQDDDVGWSESWIRDYNATPLGDNRDIARTYLRLRLALSGAQIFIPYVRFSTLGAAQNLVEFDNPGYISVPPGAGAPLDPVTGNPTGVPVNCAIKDNPERPYSVLLLRCESVPSGYTKNMFLSGIPDSVITDPEGPSAPNGWLAAFQAWANFIVGLPPGGAGNGWKFPVTTRGLGAPRFPIKSVVAGVPNTFTLQTGSFNVDDPVHIGGFRGQPGYKTTGFITSAQSGVYQISNWGPPASQGFPKGYAQKIIKTFAICNNIQIRGETHRSRGRVFGQPVGRRKARART